jgi:hypothetical protein
MLGGWDEAGIGGTCVCMWHGKGGQLAVVGLCPVLELFIVNVLVGRLKTEHDLYDPGLQPCVCFVCVCVCVWGGGG